MVKLKVDKTGRELTTHGSWGFPFTACTAGVSICSYEGARFEAHFHPATEVTQILSGEMYYQTNDRVFSLREGDVVFANSEVVHSGWQKDGSNCVYRVLNFSTLMIAGHEHSRIGEKYVTPLAEEEPLPYLVFRREREEDAPLLALTDRLFQTAKAREDGYELLIKADLCLFWHALYLRAKAHGAIPQDRNTQVVKKAIVYMEEHYRDRITLSDLASVCGLSRSEFCRTFRKYTARTPFSYLQHLRIRRSLPLLESGAAITEVAGECGFSGASYYAEIFRRYFGISPVEYRKKSRELPLS